jgi:hypothetical protein
MVSYKRGIDKATAICRAFALLQIADEQMEQGREFGIIYNDGGTLKVVGKIGGMGE